MGQVSGVLRSREAAGGTVQHHHRGQGDAAVEEEWWLLSPLLHSHRAGRVCQSSSQPSAEQGKASTGAAC